MGWGGGSGPGAMRVRSFQLRRVPRPLQGWTVREVMTAASAPHRHVFLEGQGVSGLHRFFLTELGTLGEVPSSKIWF